MKFILPILAMLFTVLATLVAVVFCMGMGANATPAQIRALKLWMSGFSLLCLAGIVISILLMRSGQMGWATGTAFAPAVIIMVIFVAAILK